MLTFEGQQFMGTANISQKMAVRKHARLVGSAWEGTCPHIKTHTLVRTQQSLGKLAHNVQRFDVQPSVDQNNLVIFVVGQVKVRSSAYDEAPYPATHDIGSGLALSAVAQFRSSSWPSPPHKLTLTISLFIPRQLDGQENPLQFAEFFQLVASAPGAYHIHNQIFRLIYG